MEKMRPTKKKALLLAAGCLALAAVVVIAFFVLRPAPKTLYHPPARPGHRSDPSAQWGHTGCDRPCSDRKRLWPCSTGLPTGPPEMLLPLPGGSIMPAHPRTPGLTISPSSPQAPCAFGTMTAVPPFIPAHPGISSPWSTWRTVSPLSFLEKALSQRNTLPHKGGGTSPISI